MAIDNVGTVIDTEMCQTSQMAALLSVEGLHRVGQMLVFLSLGTAVERHDDDVGLFAQLAEYTADGI